MPVLPSSSIPHIPGGAVALPLQAGVPGVRCADLPPVLLHPQRVRPSSPQACYPLMAHRRRPPKHPAYKEKHYIAYSRQIIGIHPLCGWLCYRLLYAVR